MNETSSNSLSTELRNRADETQYKKEIIAEYTEIRTWKSRMKSILKWFFIYTFTLFIGGILFLELCHYIADKFALNYVNVWKNLLWFLVLCNGLNLFRVQNYEADTYTEYENNFTPMKAIFCVIRILILIGLLFISSIGVDDTGNIEKMLKNETTEITSTSKDKEIKQNEETIKKNTTNSSTTNNVNPTNGMYYRD